MFFTNWNKEIIHLGNLADSLSQFVDQAPGDNYDLLVGSDSQRKGLVTTHATVVFLWNLATRKFRMFYNKERISHTGTIDLATRIITEATRSMEVAYALKGSKLVDTIGNDSMEVHVDIGLKGKSRKVINTCTGMIRGAGIRCKIKPDAWLASAVADRLSK